LVAKWQQKKKKPKMQFSQTNENIDFEGSIPANHTIKKVYVDLKT